MKKKANDFKTSPWTFEWRSCIVYGKIAAKSTNLTLSCSTYTDVFLLLALICKANSASHIMNIFYSALKFNANCLFWTPPFTWCASVP